VTKNEIINGVQVQVEVIPVGGNWPLNSVPGHLRGVQGRDPSVCLAAVEVFSFSVPTRKRTKRTRNNVEAEAEVLTVGGEKPVHPALDHLQKRMALELQALRELLKKAELIHRRPACKIKRLLAPEPQRMEVGGKTSSLKRRKVSPLLEQRHAQKQRKAPRMSFDERERLAGRLASLAAVPDHIVEFLQQQLGSDADDPHGEIEIDMHSVQDSVLFELKARLDKLAEERLAADAAVPKEERGPVIMELDSDEVQRSRRASEVAQSSEPKKKVQDAQCAAAPKAAFCLSDVLFRAKVRRELLKMEKVVLPDESINQRDLQRLSIAEYGRPSVMRQLGLFLIKADA
jgi:hypothetical protein